jgi:hypothetical protein
MAALTIVLPDHPLRRATEDLIRAVYEDQYGARVESFPIMLAALTTPGGAPYCAAGMRMGIPECWSEHYLDERIQDIVSRAIGEPIRRNQILEVTGLASSGTGVSFILLRELISYAVARGIRLGVFTATLRLRRAIEAARVPLMRLAPAARARVPNPEMWGSYYQNDPWVCGIVDPHTLPWPNRLRMTAIAAPDRLQVA